MKLAIGTPLAIVVEADDVVHVRAEDETGAFGILRGHADFVTVLAISVVTWRDAAGAEHHAAVRGGVLEVRAGESIAVATREAVAGDDLARLENDVLAWIRRSVEAERAARTDAERLYLAAIRQICRFLGSGRTHPLAGGPTGPPGGAPA
jgi:F-type H+-transporting ATPase subunit epsilon